ncbi:MAG: DUF3667 domain-containing protein [Bacteroidales bacterium]|nr:DUF3667 domain-containing protein [Bacteroidales bacterium]
MENNKVVDKEQQVTKCLNCNTEFQGKFCPECGQRADTKRFTIRFIFTNLLQAILSNDGGVWTTLKSLFTRPGAMVVDILNGKRKSYFSPFPMLFLTLSLYVVIFTFTGSKDIDYDNLLNDDNTEVVVNDGEQTNEQVIVDKAKNFIINALKFYSNHYTAAFILTIPVYILAARLSYGKKNRKKYNWGEYCIPIVYSLILLVLYRCVMSIVYYFSPEIADKMEDWIILLNIVVFTACFKNMFEFRIVKMVWRSFLTIVLYWVLFITIALMIAGIAAFILFMIHPEYLG